MSVASATPAAAASPSGDLAIETTGLTKRFGSQRAVHDLDLAVPRGSVFGFLGPNGSGKTTTIRMLLGLASATSGSARLLGRDTPRELARTLPRVGALIEGPAFYPFLSGQANLRRMDAADRTAEAATRNRRVATALERVGLTAAAHKKARAYSLGMKQRLGIAAALLRPRDLLVLDEPTNGLDPQGTREVRSLIRSLADGGTTVFVSSHLLAEVEQICTHAAVMHLGSLMAQDSLDELRGSARMHLRTPDGDLATGELTRLGLHPRHDAGAHRAGRGAFPAGSGETAHATGAGDAHLEADLPEKPEDVVAALVAAGVRVRGFEVRTPSLEDLFVSLTGEGFDVDG